jgi:hypothetical protein
MPNEKLTPSQVEAINKFLLSIFHGIVEPLHREATARGTVLITLKKLYPHLAKDIDDTLAAARVHPDLESRLHNEYHVTLEKVLHSLLEKIQSQDSSYLESFVKNWSKPLN